MDEKRALSGSRGTRSMTTLGKSKTTILCLKLGLQQIGRFGWNL